MATHVKPIETLDVVAVALLQNTGELVLIDVREPEEYAAERRDRLRLLDFSVLKSQLDSPCVWSTVG